MADLIYEVTMSGEANDAVRAAFDDCELVARQGTTIVRCSHDALQGVLDRIHHLGLDLIELTSSGEPPSTG